MKTRNVDSIKARWRTAFLPRLLLCWLAFVGTAAHGIEVDPKASIAQTDTTILGLNHVGLSVANLEQTLAFYRQATGFTVLHRERVEDSPAADKLFGRSGVRYESVTLQAPNMLFEITEFAHNKDGATEDQAVYGPGFTHTCFQSPESDSGYDHFVKAGAKMLTRGNGPVKLGDYGVSYAYAYDPEGNMFEMEQLDDEMLARAGYNTQHEQQQARMWMSQVALATHDIEALMSFYQQVLGFAPSRTGEYNKRKAMDEVGNLDDAHLLGGWFRMNEGSKMMEFWQYINPQTPPPPANRESTDLGYSFSLEVGDIQAEYRRLKEMGVTFVSEPVLLGQFWQVIAHDPDNNVFLLRQAVEESSAFSVRSFDPVSFTAK